MNRFPGTSQLPESIVHLLILNVFFFVFTTSTSIGKDWSGLLMGHFYESPYFRPWQAFTHMFMHGGIMHIFFNMYFGVYMFGSTLARIWGNQRFIIFYLTCGLGAFLLHQVFYLYEMNVIGSTPVPFLGASGAVYGVLMAFAYLFPNMELSLLFIPVRFKAKYFVMGLLAIDLFLGFSNVSSGVAHLAHFGGALVGFIMLKYWQGNKKRFY